MDNRESEGLVKGDGTERGGLWSGRGLSGGVGVLGSLGRAEAKSLQRVVSADTGGAEEEAEAAEDPRQPGPRWGRARVLWRSVQDRSANGEVGLSKYTMWSSKGHCSQQMITTEGQITQYNILYYRKSSHDYKMSSKKCLFTKTSLKTGNI